MITDEEFRNLEERVKKLEEIFSDKRVATKPNKKTIIDFIIDLKNSGFFDQPKTPKEILGKLAENGYHYPYESLTAPLIRAVKRGIIGRLKKDDSWVYTKR